MVDAQEQSAKCSVDLDLSESPFWPYPMLVFRAVLGLSTEHHFSMNFKNSPT